MHPSDPDQPSPPTDESGATVPASGVRTATNRPGGAPATEPVWLGVDLGTQGVRAALVDGDGTLLGAGSVPLRGARRDGADGHHEQDPAEWWRATCDAVRSALEGRRGRPVGAVAVDATSGTFVLQDADARPLGPGVMYDDRRAVAEAARLRDAEAAYWDAIGASVQPSWALPKLSLLARAGRLRPGRGTVAHQGDHIAGRLAGTAVPTDTSQALKTGYDLLRDRWPDDLLGRCGIAPEVLPAVVVPGTPVARTGRDAARLTGLPEGTPIRAGMTDGCAAQVATAALQPGRWCSALGTTLVLKGASREPVRDPGGAVYCHRNPDGGWLPGGASHTGTAAFATDLPGEDLAALTDRVRQWPVPAGATYPLAGTGERFPFVAGSAHAFDTGPGGGDTDAAGRFHRLAHGLAYVERLAFDTLGALGADVSGTVTVTGGATANDWLTALRADVLGRPVLVPEHADSAFGSAVLAAAPPGQLGATARHMVRIRTRFEPASDGTARRAALDEGYRRLVAALRDRGWLEPAAGTHGRSPGTHGSGPGDSPVVTP